MSPEKNHEMQENNDSAPEKTEADKKSDVCGQRCEVFSRVVGYFRPVQQWNLGKKEEFKDRVAFDEGTSLKSKYGTLGRPREEAQKISNY